MERPWSYFKKAQRHDQSNDVRSSVILVSMLYLIALFQAVQWSYLRKFSGMTKVMTPDHRSSVLSEAISHYADKSISNIGMHVILGSTIPSGAIPAHPSP